MDILKFVCIEFNIVHSSLFPQRTLPKFRQVLISLFCLKWSYNLTWKLNNG